MKTTPSKIQKARQTFNDAMTNLTAVGGEYRAARDAVSADQDLTDEAKARKTSELHESFRAETNSRQRTAVEALADYLAILEVTANPPAATGIEGVADRVEAADARARVRGMLDRGANPNKILSRAVDIGDLTALDALKTEAPWIEGAGPGLLARIDQARADVIGGERGEAIRDGLAMADQRQAWIDKIQRASSELGNGPTLASAVSDHYSGIARPVGDAGASGESEAA